MTSWSEREDQTRATYEVIAAAYTRRQDRLGHISQWADQLLAELVDAVAPGAIVVDLGCGPALHVSYMRSRGLTVFGVDLSQAMLGQARGRDPELAGKLVAGRVEQLPLRSSSVGALWSSFALLHIPAESMPGVFSEVHRVLVPDGVAYLTFAGGELPYVEEVTYWAGAFRTFHPLPAREASDMARSANLSVVAQSADPDGHRSIHHLTAKKERPSSGSP